MHRGGPIRSGHREDQSQLWTERKDQSEVGIGGDQSELYKGEDKSELSTGEDQSEMFTGEDRLEL